VYLYIEIGGFVVIFNFNYDIRAVNVIIIVYNRGIFAERILLIFVIIIEDEIYTVFAAGVVKKNIYSINNLTVFIIKIKTSVKKLNKFININ